MGVWQHMGVPVSRRVRAWLDRQRATFLLVQRALMLVLRFVGAHNLERIWACGHCSPYWYKWYCHTCKRIPALLLCVLLLLLCAFDWSETVRDVVYRLAELLGVGSECYYCGDPCFDLDEHWQRDGWAVCWRCWWQPGEN